MFLSLSPRLFERNIKGTLILPVSCISPFQKIHVPAYTPCPPHKLTCFAVCGVVWEVMIQSTTIHNMWAHSLPGSYLRLMREWCPPCRRFAISLNTFISACMCPTLHMGETSIIRLCYFPAAPLPGSKQSLWSPLVAFRCFWHTEHTKCCTLFPACTPMVQPWLSVVQ